MITIEDIKIWINENGDSEGFYDTEAEAVSIANELVKRLKTKN